MGIVLDYNVIALQAYLPEFGSQKNVLRVSAKGMYTTFSDP